MTNILTESFLKFVPSKQVTIRPMAPAWTNTYTRLLQRRKNRNYTFYKQARTRYMTASSNPASNPDILITLQNRQNKAYSKATESRNNSTNANKRAKTSFYNSVNSTMNNSFISAKKKFGILKKLMQNQKVSTIPPLIENDVTITDPKKKADILNSHFASKAKVQGNNDEIPFLDKKENIFSELSNINTSPIEISKIIRTLKKSNQSHCGVPAKFLSLIATPVSFALSRMYNNLFEIGHFPDVFKLAHITAIWKQKGLKSSKLFYRPISLLPTLSKIYESVMHNRLLSHCTENNIISERQAAYIKGDSTVNQLLYLVHTIRTAWTNKNTSHGIFLDVMGAFETVWHRGLLAKLSQHKISGKCHDLFQSYLSNRKQVVVVDGQK